LTPDTIGVKTLSQPAFGSTYKISIMGSALFKSAAAPPLFGISALLAGCGDGGGAGVGRAAQSVLAEEQPDASLAAGAPQYAYATDFFGGKVWEYGITPSGALLPLRTPTVAAGINPSGIASDPTGHYLYVTNEGPGPQGAAPGTISQYSIGKFGTLTAMPKQAAGATPTSITVDPTGHYAYVANYADGDAINPHIGSVSQYTIGAGGALMPMTPATVDAGIGTSAVALHPTAAFAYVVNYIDGTVMVFAVGSGGVLGTTPISTVQLAGTNPKPLPGSMIIDPTGAYLYVANFGNSTIGQFSIDGATGALTPMAMPYVQQSVRTLAVNHTAAANYVYTVDYTSGQVVEYKIGTRGNLEAVPPSVMVCGPNCPNFIAFDQTGNYAYVADRTAAAISQFKVDGATGALTAQIPALVPTGKNPLYIVTTKAY
jgi:6-phosphogluconolactonase (cycloisomerase 2 family)